MSEPVIVVEGLATRFGRQVVHEDISMTVERGELLAIVGGSGSGKTTLLRQMLGLERPAAGRVSVLGEPPGTPPLAGAPPRWGVLFQEGALFSALSVFDNVALPLRELKALDEALIRDLVLARLQMVGIGPEHAAKMPAELSGGMVKRIGLARALVLDPELLFLDEPTAGLDPDRSDAFVQLIRRLRDELKLTVVMVTHDLDTLVSLADRVAVLAEQRLLVLCGLKDVIRFEHPFIEHFFRGERGRRAMQRARRDDLLADLISV